MCEVTVWITTVRPDAHRVRFCGRLQPIPKGVGGAEFTRYFRELFDSILEPKVMQDYKFEVWELFKINRTVVNK